MECLFKGWLDFLDLNKCFFMMMIRFMKMHAHTHFEFLMIRSMKILAHTHLEYSVYGGLFQFL